MTVTTTALRTPLVARSRAELAAARAALLGRVAFVPTMGALHDGHAQLMRVAHEHADHVVVSIFVNPLQFGAGEDFDRYPRTLDDDLDVCTREGVALVWAPTPDVVYPDQPRVTVRAGVLGDVLEGASRPGHFDGVLTVVAKLFHHVRPDVAVFGEKDAQQLALIRRMVRDLDFGIQIVGVPTVREPDGVALSSRNRYLSRTERQRARALSRALRAAVDAAERGGASDVCAAALGVLDDAGGVVLDYLVLVDEETFDEVSDDFAGPARLLVAARVGTTRLIDNMPLFLGTRTVG